MRTMQYFESEHFMGIEVTNINDAMKAKEIGLDLISENGDVIGYDIEDKDGNERPMTDEEICKDILKIFELGGKVYAGSYLDNGTIVSDGKATLLASEYRVGQKVYFMKDDKPTEGVIGTIVLRTHLDGSFGKEYHVKLPYMYVIKKEGEFFSTKEELVKHLMGED